MRQSHKTILLWFMLFLAVVTVYQLITGSRRGEETRPTFSEFMRDVEQNPGRIKYVRIDGQNYHVRYDEPPPRDRATIIGPTDLAQGHVLAALDKAKIKYEIEKRDDGGWLTLLLGSWLPMLAMVFFFFLVMRQLQAGGGKAMSFGKAKAKLLTDHQNKVTFADVAGVEEAKDEVEEIIAFLKDPRKFTRLGGRIPKGVLMMGPPGTGKTLLARAIAGEAGVPFFSISGSDFVEMFVGVGASRVRDLFEQGKKHAPCIIFIDEIDAVGRHRGAGLGGGHDEREQTLNQLLVEMDGFESNDGVIMIAATNRPDVLDPALLRPGRFDRRIVVPRPDVKGREGILRVHARKVPLGPDVDLSVVARGTPGFSGADLESLVNEAALLAARRDKDVVEMRDFEEAKDKVLMGPERRSMVISEREKRMTAFHEAGHALVARLVKGADPVHRVTIIPRGPSLGLTQQLPSEDRFSATKEWAEAHIAVCMGGRVAEEIIFGHLTTGAGNDLEQATNLARKMVCSWGMSEKLGPLTFGKREEHIFLGREIAQQQDYSEETAHLIDEEVKRIVMQQYERARRLIETHLEELKRLAEALLEHETLSGDDIDVILRGGTLPRRAGLQPASAAEPRAQESKRPSLFGRPGLLEDPEPEQA
ncbi:MAG: ATP-dependent zinc metalloprotease FtsH [Myxococcales bacterium]|nr:ATP-dependent zinc metalloprotease FtsH [Myxococcota bacterium]MDW8283025.1 ATP-dependent zinc metalloprotease FtsH [Myxococcales bacterium]